MNEREDLNTIVREEVNEAVGSDDQLANVASIKFRNDSSAFGKLIQ